MDIEDSVRHTGKRLETNEFTQGPRQRTELLVMFGPAIKGSSDGVLKSPFDLVHTVF